MLGRGKLGEYGYCILLEDMSMRVKGGVSKGGCCVALFYSGVCPLGLANSSRCSALKTTVYLIYVTKCGILPSSYLEKEIPFHLVFTFLFFFLKLVVFLNQRKRAGVGVVCLLGKLFFSFFTKSSLQTL